MEKQNTNELTATIQSVMKEGNYSQKQVEDFSLFVDNIIKQEFEVLA